MKNLPHRIRQLIPVVLVPVAVEVTTDPVHWIPPHAPYVGDAPGIPLGCGLTTLGELDASTDLEVVTCPGCLARAAVRS